MTYNILDGGEGREEYLPQVLQAVQPDVALLQEVFHEDLIQNLGRILKMNSFFASGNKKRRVALLSRLPVVSRQSFHPFPPIWRNVVQATIEYQPGKRFLLFGIHPMANLSVICESWRWWEARRIIEHIRPHVTERCVIAGDFNAIAPHDRVMTQPMPRWLKLTILTQGNRVYHFSIQKYLSAGFTDCFRVLHPGDDGFTLPPPSPNSRLDYIFVNEMMKSQLTDCWIVHEPSAVLRLLTIIPLSQSFDCELSSTTRRCAPDYFT